MLYATLKSPVKQPSLAAANLFTVDLPVEFPQSYFSVKAMYENSIAILANLAPREHPLRRQTYYCWLSLVPFVLIVWSSSFASMGSAFDGGGTDSREAETESSSDQSDQGFRADPAEGYRLLTTKAYLPAHFDEESVANVWKAWPEPLQSMARNSTEEERRALIFERYGFTERLDYETGLPDGSGKPLQYVVSEDGGWSMNCFACHGGTILGQSVPGAPNHRFAFELFAKEIRESKVKRGRPLNSFDFGSLLMPLGRTRGTTNAVMFGVGLMHYRDENLNVISGKLPPRFTHHDMDAPPWWYFRKRPRMYIDGFAEKGHRGLLQFMMVEENDADTLKNWESDFRHIYAFLASLEVPKYPGPVDENQANAGHQLFEQHCSECHGSYNSTSQLFDEVQASYPSRRIPLDEIGTDPVRLTALRSEGREKYARSWFTYYGQEETETEPDGYVAPPLDGVWASAPYFHNGSVPTLWGVLDSKSRPSRWRHRMSLDGTEDRNFDEKEIGLAHEVLAQNPVIEQGRGEVLDAGEIFDTRKFGKSNAGHTFPDPLSDLKKRQLLEYLKTL
ncbi:MAG: hypothetical protein ACE361_02505 [Aureliella sp.]